MSGLGPSSTKIASRVVLPPSTSPSAIVVEVVHFTASRKLHFFEHSPGTAKKSPGDARAKSEHPAGARTACSSGARHPAHFMHALTGACMPRAQVGRCRVLGRRAVKGRWRLRGGRGGGRQDAGPVGGQEGVDDPGWGGQPSWVVGALGGPVLGAVQAQRARCVPSVRRFVVRSCVDHVASGSCPFWRVSLK